MRIGFVWDGNYPWDVRVEKICLRLIQAGHEVHMVCRNTKQQPMTEVIDDIRIHRLPRFNLSRKINELINFPFFFNPIWYSEIRRVFAMERVDAVIVRDITLSLTALGAVSKRGIPVVLDMAEPYPEMIRAQHAYGDLRGVRKLVRNAGLAEWVEKETLKKVHMTFAMIEESRDRIVGMGIPEEKVSIVSNTPDLRKFQRGRPVFPGAMAGHRSGTIFLYIGFLDLYRGVQIAIRGFPKVLDNDPNAVLIIVGSGKREGELKRIAKELGIHNSVVFEGYQPHTRIPDYVASCDVGVIPHFACGLWNNTIPNKLFDYMCMSKPVLSSDAVPVKRILETERCGLTYNSTRSSEFGDQAVRLLDRNLRQRLGENGLKAVSDRYNWAVDAEEMLGRIEALFPPAGSWKHAV